MNSNAIRLIAIVLGVIAVVLVIIGWRMSRSFAERAEQAESQQAQAAGQPAAPQIMVVVATKPLPANRPIASGDVTLAPLTIAPTEYFANVDDAIGRKPMVDIDAGAPVVPRFFKDVNLIARGVPDGHRALSLKVDDVVGVGGFVRPGDVVDVLLYVKAASATPTGEDGPQADATTDIPTQARVLIRDVKVLSYEEHLVEPPKGIEESKTRNGQQPVQRRERTAVLAVPEPQVTRVMLGASYGELRLALHGTPAEGEAAEATTVTAAADATTETVSALQAEPAKPLSPAEQARAETAAALAALEAQRIVTAPELTELAPKVKKTAQGRVVSAAPPKLEIIRGSERQTVSP